MIINRPAPQRPRAPEASGNPMKAFVIRSYGASDRLVLADVETPVPANNEVLVRVRATSVNPYDWHHMRGEPYIARLMGGLGLRRPKFTILGADMAGQVEAVGKDVTRFAPGDEVFAVLKGGGFAEYVCVPEADLAPKPRNLTFEQAAAVPLAASTALLGVRDEGRVQPGQRVLVNGASGGVGTFAVQTRPSIRRGGHRRMQHAQRGPGSIDRCRRRH